MIVSWSEGKQGSGPEGDEVLWNTGGLLFVLRYLDEMLHRGLTEGLQELKLRSKKADIRPENANWKFERADLRLGRAGLRLEGPES